MNTTIFNTSINEGINNLDNLYTVKRELYLPNPQSIEVNLLTKDKAFSEFSRKTDLILEVIENLRSAAFGDIISGFKWVLPNAGNINGGIGVFGSYLKNTKTVNK